MVGFASGAFADGYATVGAAVGCAVWMFMLWTTRLFAGLSSFVALETRARNFNARLLVAKCARTVTATDWLASRRSYTQRNRRGAVAFGRAHGAPRAFTESIVTPFGTRAVRTTCAAEAGPLFLMVKV